MAKWDRQCTHRVCFLGDVDTAVFSFNLPRKEEQIVGVLHTPRWVVGGDVCPRVRCEKPQTMDPDAILLVLQADRKASGMICCKVFSDVLKVDVYEIEKLHCLLRLT